MSYTATEYTLSQMSGKLHRVGWRKFATRRGAEDWARRRLSTPLLAPHWIHIKVYRGRKTLTAYRGDGSGEFYRATFDHQRS